MLLLAMPIERREGFYQSEDLGHVESVGIESDRVRECVDFAKVRRIRGVFGFPGFGFAGTDLDFLAELPWLESVWFWDIHLKNVDGLYALPELQRFGVHPKRPPIDFSRFPRLREAVVEPRARDRGLGTLTELESLHYWRLRPKDRSFDALEFPDSLVELEINWANVESLDSLPALPNLRRLGVHRCRNLTDLGDLGQKFPKLEHLVVAACGRVLPGEGERVIQTLPKLIHAFVRDSVLGTGAKGPLDTESRDHG